jgi:transglutaminase-like putative cysteine protease
MIINSTDLNLNLFLSPAPGIQCDHPEVYNLAQSIVKGSKNNVEAARQLFEYVRDTIRYSLIVPLASFEDYLALNTLARGKGFCIQKAALLCALARTLGIPSRLGFADIRNERLYGYLREIIPDKIVYYHCFIEWFIGERWLKSTPSFDKTLTERYSWQLVEFNPTTDALLPAVDLQGRPHVSYLTYHGWRLGVPLTEFISITDYYYGEGSIARLDAKGRASLAY